MCDFPEFAAAVWDVFDIGGALSYPTCVCGGHSNPIPRTTPASYCPSQQGVEMALRCPVFPSRRSDLAREGPLLVQVATKYVTTRLWDMGLVSEEACAQAFHLLRAYDDSGRRYDAVRLASIAKDTLCAQIVKDTLRGDENPKADWVISVMGTFVD
jgi:hypothetical protein